MTASEDLFDRVDRPRRLAVARGGREEAIEEGILGSPRVEARRRPKVVFRGIYRFAACERREHLRWAVPEPERRHVNQRAVVRLERDAQVELEDAVRTKERPISAAGKNAPAEAWSFEMAAGDRCDGARSVRHCADLLRGC